MYEHWQTSSGSCEDDQYTKAKRSAGEVATHQREFSAFSHGQVAVPP